MMDPLISMHAPVHPVIPLPEGTRSGCAGQGVQVCGCGVDWCGSIDIVGADIIKRDFFTGIKNIFAVLKHSVIICLQAPEINTYGIPGLIIGNDGFDVNGRTHLGKDWLLAIRADDRIALQVVKTRIASFTMMFGAPFGF